MSKIKFSEVAIKKLEENPNIKRVSEKAITYAYEFKIKFIEEYLKGKLPRKIFEESGFEIEMIGMKRVNESAYRWSKAYKNDGIIGLRDTRKGSSGRPRLNGLSQDEIIKRQEAKIKLLEGQVELLKKLDKIERRLINRHGNLEPKEVFKLLYDTVTKYKLTNMISYFCNMLCVSRSGYYRHVSTSKARDRRELLDLEYRDIILKAFNKRGYKKKAPEA